MMLTRMLPSLLGRTSRAAGTRRRALHVEPLESRQMLATILVTTTADVIDPNDGETSLREAIIQANNSGEANEIVLPPGHYVLTRIGTGDDAAITGDLDITSPHNLEIRGGISGASIIDAAGIDRVFQVLTGADLTLRNVVVRGGDATFGGGILNTGRLTIIDSIIADNFAGLRGGGIDSSGIGSSILNIEGSQFIGNRAGDISSPSSSGLGGAINAGSTSVSISDTLFLNNTAGGTGSGGAINARFSNTQIQFSTFEGNQAGEGGAMATLGSNIWVTGSTFADNQAVKDGGRGGAIFGQSEVYIRQSTFHQNSAGFAGRGGALSNAAFMEVVNSTITGNTAGVTGTFNSSRGGGIYNEANLRLFFATVVQNVQVGGGVTGGVFSDMAGTSTLLSTIIALNGAGADNAPDLRGAFVSLGGNLIGRNTGAATGTFLSSDQVGTGASPIDPLVGPLADNGGPTLTHALLPVSPAIDRGVFSTGIAPSEDQRFLPRPVGAAPDVGAYEVQPPNNTPPIAVDDEYDMDEDTLLSVAAAHGLLANDSDEDGDALVAVLEEGPSHGTLLLNDDGSFTYQPDPDFFGSDSFTYRASDGTALSDLATVTITVRDVSDVLQVTIDIQPGDPNDTVELKKSTTIGVAILSIADFDARDVDIDSLRFGRTGDEDSLMRHKKTGEPKTFEWIDVNGDGLLDLVVQFQVELTGLELNDTEALLTGRLSDGTAISGFGSISVSAHPGKGRK